MDLRQGLGQIAIALVGDDDAGAGLGDQEVRAGDADIGIDIFLPQFGARLIQQGARLLQRAIRVEMVVRLMKGFRHLVFSHVDRRRDNMARRLVAQLDDVFAQVGLDRLNIVRFEIGVEADLLGDHRFALGRRPGVDRTADVEDDAACVFRRGRPMHRAPGLPHLGLEGFEVEIEMRQRVVLDLAALVAQRLELRQAGGRGGAVDDEAAFHLVERGLQRLVGERFAGVLLEPGRRRFHSACPSPIAGSSVMPASTSAT